MTEEARQRIHDALSAASLLSYEDYPGAYSSHGMAYKVLAMSGPEPTPLVDAAVKSLREAKRLGATYIVWRRKPRCEMADGKWVFSARFHLLPKEVDDLFWRGTEAKPEGASVKELA